MTNLRKLLLIISTIFLLAGCQKTDFDDNKFNIVASFYPMYVLTQNVTEGIEDVQVTNLTAPTTGCLHDYQITTQDMIKLSHADALVVNGDGMENFIIKAINTYEDLNIVYASEGIKEKLEKEEHEHEDEHDEDEHEHEEAHDEEEHDDGHNHEENSHYWVSISLYIEQVKNVAEQLGKIDEKNKDLYERNAQKYIEKLTTLKNQMHEQLDDLPNKNIITFHEAFEYFADEFDFDIVAVIEREPGTYPSSKEVAEIIDLVKEKDVKAVFVEPQYSRSAADTIARETKVEVYSLDPIVTGSDDADSYIKIMTENMNTLIKALKGSE